ncbi:major head protein [Pseudomonas aeruginosa]|nr:major head protein [Pseudomonas aeruginosa]
MLANEKRDGGEEAPKTAGQMVAESLKEQGVTSSLRGSHRVSMPRSAITLHRQLWRCPWLLLIVAWCRCSSAASADHPRPWLRRAPLNRTPSSTFARPASSTMRSCFGRHPEAVLGPDLRAGKRAGFATIAHLFKASRQIPWDDAYGLAELHRDARARYGLMLVEEGQLLYGNGTGCKSARHHSAGAGLRAPPSGVVVTAEQRIDRIRLAILQAQLAEFPASGIVLNPIDWALIELTKDAENRYIIGSPHRTAPLRPSGVCRWWKPRPSLRTSS